MPIRSPVAFSGRACRTAGLLLSLLAGCAAPPSALSVDFDAGVDRVWVGPEFWANRLQDWRVHGGRLECIGTSLPYRTLHATTRRIGAGDGDVRVVVTIGPLAGEGAAADACAGVLLGAGAADLDWRAACLEQSAPGPDGVGVLCGVTRGSRCSGWILA